MLALVRDGEHDPPVAVREVPEPEPAAHEALDFEGASTLEVAGLTALRIVRLGGSVVLFGATVGEPARVALFDFVGHEGARIVPFLSYASGTEEDIGADLATLAGLVGDGDLETTVGLVVDWREPEHAIEALREGDVEGKAVLVVGG